MKNNNWLSHSSVYSLQHKKIYRWVLYPVILINILFMLFLILGKSEVVIRTSAQLSASKITRLQVPVNAKIKENFLKENLKIKKGELLVSFDSTDLSTQKEQLDSENQIINNQKNAAQLCIDSLNQETNLFETDDSYGYTNKLKAFLAEKDSVEQSNQQLALNAQQNQFIYEKSNEQLKQQIVNRKNEETQWQKIRLYWINEQAINGFSEEITSKYQIWQKQLVGNSEEEKVQIKAAILNTIDEKTTQLKSEREQLEIENSKLVSPPTFKNDVQSQNDKLIQAKEELISTVKQKMTELDEAYKKNELLLKNLDEQIAQYDLVAPVNGVIHLNSEYNGLKEVPQGTLLADIYPEKQKDNLIFIAKIPSNEMSRVQKGMLVRFKLDKKGVAEKTISGSITEISETSELTKEGTFYTIKGDLSSDNQNFTRYGLTGDLFLVVGKKSYWRQIKDTLLNFE